MKKIFWGEDIHLAEKNIFDLQNSESLVCQVELYRASHKTLIILVQDTSQTQDKAKRFYLVFSPVDYFEGPTSWKGGNFYAGPLSEYVNIIYKSQSLNEIPDELLQNVSDAYSTSGRLFIVDTPNLQVRFTANEVILTDDITEWK